MRFYYNINLALCAEEQWVIEYLFNNSLVNSREEAFEGLRTRREFEGWFDCEVSNTIDELISDYYGVY